MCVCMSVCLYICLSVCVEEKKKLSLSLLLSMRLLAVDAECIEPYDGGAFMYRRQV